MTALDINARAAFNEAGEALGFAFDHMEAELAKGVALAANILKRAIAINATSRLDKGSSDGSTTGHLRESILKSGIVVARKSLITGLVGSKLPYARIQDVGGVIKARKKLLAIPIGIQKKRPNQGPNDFDGHWRAYDGPRGPGVGFFDNETDQLLYVGKASVKIEPTRYFSDGVKMKTGAVVKAISDAVGGVIEEIPPESDGK